ncbi:Rieske 2Fe-2S domain-containing protein [Sphingopyxis lindanitolerans]|nr:Rieske 2Fe-2S domain-containing protein [Sphingopyxis lindanitolerans]
MTKIAAPNTAALGERQAMPSKETNELLTRVEGDAPMGRMLRQHHWVPAVRAAKLVADGAPAHVRLFGRDYVAFRATDGRVGLLDEACPHRRASLLLARNEDCALTCIFHGWKIGVDGTLLDTPTQFHRKEAFAASVKVRRYPVREAGGLVWVWLGDDGEAPPFPEFEFTQLPPENIVVASAQIDCNWIQGLEAALDPVHVGILHSSFIGSGRGYLGLTSAATPYFQVLPKDFGLQVAALRPLGDGTTYVRVTSYVMPYYGFTPPNDPKLADRTVLIAVPVDDTHTRQFFVRYNLFGSPIDNHFAETVEASDPDNYTPFPGGKDAVWGQDREAMKNGHFTGFPRNIFSEDMVVQVSMGPITDRSEEHLSESDIGIVHGRRLLIEAACAFQEGKHPVGAPEGIDYRSVRAPTGLIKGGTDWQAELSTLEDAPTPEPSLAGEPG